MLAPRQALIGALWAPTNRLWARLAFEAQARGSLLVGLWARGSDPFMGFTERYIQQGTGTRSEFKQM